MKIPWLPGLQSVHSANSFSISPKTNSYNMNCTFQLLYTNYKLTIQQTTSCSWNFQYETRDNGITPIHEVTPEHKTLQGLGKAPVRNSRQQALWCSVLLQRATISQRCDLLSNKAVRRTHSPAQLAQRSKELLLSYTFSPRYISRKIPGAIEYSQQLVGRTKLPFVKRGWSVAQVCFHSKGCKIPM